MLQDGSREPQTDRTNTAWRPGCMPHVPGASGARGAWVLSNSASGQFHQTTQTSLFAAAVVGQIGPYAPTRGAS